jgi:hypothetical protein
LCHQAGSGLPEGCPFVCRSTRPWFGAMSAFHNPLLGVRCRRPTRRPAAHTDAY